MKRVWTKSQEQAIEARDGTVLVSAAAGSGKTAVLVERVIERITKENPVDIEKLLIVTYTRAAAAEMKERIAKRLSEMICENPLNQNLKRQKIYLPNAQISTIDSFCGALVKENFEKADILPDYTMLSEVEHEMLKKETVAEVLEEVYSWPKENTEEFLRLFNNSKNDNNLSNSIFKLYEYAMASKNPTEWIENAFQDYFDVVPIHKTKWGEYSLNRLSEILEYIKIKIEDIINDTPVGSKVRDCFEKDLAPVSEMVHYTLELINNNPEKWDEIKLATQSLDCCAGLSGVPNKEKDDYYKELKGRRDGVKKIIESTQKILICTEKEFEEDMEYFRPIMAILKKCVIRFVELLGERKKESNTYYYSDILHLALKILVSFNPDGTYEKTPLAQELSENFVEILIDEFQDTNEAQDTLFSVISKNDQNKFMVGDVKQSVYRFRQAMPEIFMGYKDRFEEYKGDNYPAVINLDKNFRSKEGIVEGINFFFDFIMTRESCGIDYKKGEQLVFGETYDTDNSADVFLHVIETDKVKGGDLVAESRHIGKIINELVSSGTLVGKKDKKRPIKYRDICILMSTLKDKASIVAKELTAMGIPVHFQKKGGFFESSEIITIFSMLQVIDNPVQDIPLISVMLSPLFSFTEDDLAKYRCEQKYGNLYNVVKNQYDKDKKAREFLDLLSLLRTLSVTMDVGSLIRRVLEITSYNSLVGAMKNGENRILNIEMLINYAENYEANGGSGLSGFIRYLERIRKDDEKIETANEISENDNVVRIMTIHKSKGLEFPVVFLANCSPAGERQDIDKVKINRKLGAATARYFPALHKDLLTLPANTVKLCEKNEEKAEKIRKLYVAMTRAEEKLYLVGSLHNSEKTIVNLYHKFYGKFTENAVPLSLCTTFMQWLLLAMMEHPSMKIDNIFNRNIRTNAPNIEFEIFEKDNSENLLSEDKETFESDDKILGEITEKLSYEYPFASISDIPVKYAASSMNREENLKYLATENPTFIGAGKLTPAQRGTINHKFMEVCDFTRAHENLTGEITRLVENNIFTQKEVDALKINSIKSFFSSELYNRIQNAEKFLREQEFTMSIPLDVINSDLSETTEKAVVQGVIDALLINGDSGEIIDYKTDRVENEDELIERYRGQMSVYKKAAEECFGLENVKVTLYSFSLSKEISLKL